MRGTKGHALDLVLLVDTTAGDSEIVMAPASGSVSRPSVRALDITESRFLITAILAGAPLLESVDALTETCRVLYVEGLAIDASGKPVDAVTKNVLEDRIRLLLPLDLPPVVSLEGGSLAVEQLIQSLTTGTVQEDLLQAVIEASASGESAVTNAIAKKIGEILEPEEQP